MTHNPEFQRQLWLNWRPSQLGWSLLLTALLLATPMALVQPDRRLHTLLIAALVGIDSHNIDDTRARARPVHTRLLGAGIPICEHMRGLERLPDAGFRFTAAPPRIKAFGTFPVRAFAEIS